MTVIYFAKKSQICAKVINLVDVLIINCHLQLFSQVVLRPKGLLPHLSKISEDSTHTETRRIVKN